MKYKPLPPLAELAAVLSYDPATGVFRNIVRRHPSAPVGRIAGCVAKQSGYVVIRHNGALYFAHRLAWLFIHGAEPTECGVDHINGCRSDNRACNLRLATPRQNGLNSKRPKRNTSGHKGVHYINRKDLRARWMAYVSNGRGNKVIGYFRRKEDAIAAYEAAAKKHYGEFARLE